ncbi:MAG: metallophosphoesterase family protein [Chitinispirillaceae bacterium]|nr:metallophosphoesterase family protein [Chitinispirillaceae bacterium]
MKIGIVSDTHGNTGLLETAVDWMVRKHKISLLYHLGDEYDDIVGLEDRYLEIVQVPGIYDERYKDGSLPAKSFETILGLAILLAHSYEKDVTKEDIQRSDIILYGHTHREELRLVDGKLFMNPGHLKGALDKNMPPTFGILNIQDRNASAAIYGLNFKLVRSMDLMRSESGLYKT